MLARMFRFCKTSICPKNPMLHDASQQLLMDDVQLATLLDRLKLSASPQASLEQRVRIGSYVTIVSSDFNENLDVQLVEPCDSKPQHNRISYLSPLGAALLGLRTGAEITVPTGAISRNWIITDVRQHPGDF